VGITAMCVKNDEAAEDKKEVDSILAPHEKARTRNFREVCGRLIGVVKDNDECCKRTPNFKKNQFIALCLSFAEVAICSVRWHFFEFSSGPLLQALSARLLTRSACATPEPRGRDDSAAPNCEPVSGECGDKGTLDRLA
jgi:hypothetical protein